MARKEPPLESGVILVAPPVLVDPNFRKSVVLLCEHSSAGSFGLILNHHVTVGMAELLADLSSYVDPVRIGGPVQLDTLHFLHRLGEEVGGAVRIFDDVFWGGEMNDLQRLFQERQPTRNELRFFLGYAGWGEGQLE
jgi:putative transcriptional regulator